MKSVCPIYSVVAAVSARTELPLRAIKYVESVEFR
jgi:hypothetical protein